MWARANMAPVTLLLLLLQLVLLACVCISTAEGGRSGSPSRQQQQRSSGGGIQARSMQQQQQQQQQISAVDADDMLERASSWLWSRRDKDAGWINDTQRVLLALRLANLSKDDNVPAQANLQMQLSTKQMELEIVLLLWRHREVGSSPMKLARYALALNAMCMDPRQFHGHDLIGALQHHEPPTDYEFALTALAACNAQAHVRKRQMRRLLDIAHTAHDHTIETLAMSIMTLRCIAQDHRHRYPPHFVRKPSISLAQRQRRDGGFGDLRATALALQALQEEAENESLDNWNRTAALLWLAHRQRADGSFDDDLQVTADVVMALAPRAIASLRMLDCGQGLADSSPPRIANINVGDPSSPLSRSATTQASVSPSQRAAAATTTATTATTTTTTTTTTRLSSTTAGLRSAGPSAAGMQQEDEDEEEEEREEDLSGSIIIGKPQAPLVNVTYTLWVGSDVDEIYNLTLSAPKNETFYEVMVLAAQRSPNFQFSAYEWPNGHYVHTLGGHKEEPMSYHYWLLYRLPAPPEPRSPPGNQLVAPGGVDDLQISNGEHYLFWYKKL